MLLLISSLLLPLLLSVNAVPSSDESCFTESTPRTREEIFNSTFFVEQGKISWQLAQNTVTQVPTTVKTIKPVCAQLQKTVNIPFCKNNEEEPEKRFLSILYNGTHVCGGMGERQVTFTNTTSDVKWKQCHYQCARTDEKSLNLSFTYFSWSGPSQDGSNKELPKDTLVLTGGVAANIGCLFLVIGFVWLTRLA